MQEVPGAIITAGNFFAEFILFSLRKALLPTLQTLYNYGKTLLHLGRIQKWGPGVWCLIMNPLGIVHTYLDRDW